ncbi:major tail protein [Bacillus pumilus]|uniref:major tail protein n=1 Tax=Bacillus pumilus TaxID=1408 RepID=UPI0011A99E8F|nr:major tail protein [Bacillus pumilus]
MGKTIYGLDMFHYAELIQDDDKGLEYAKPERLPGAVNVKVDPKSEQSKFWADNGVFDSFNNMGDIDLEAELADLPIEVQNKIFGHKVENGISFASSDDKAVFLAFGFRAKTSTGGHRYYWFLKGLPELLGNEHKTTEGKADPETPKFKAGFMTLQNKKGKNRWKAQAEFDEGFDPDEWFKQVVYDGASFSTGKDTEDSTSSVDIGKGV